MIEIFNLEPSNIKNLELKLAGKLPINRDELLALVNSWGREHGFYTKDKDNKEIYNSTFKKKKKYDLSNLDVSEITNFDNIFYHSYFNGDINSWDISNATSMNFMFSDTFNFNKPILWNLSHVEYCTGLFNRSKAFENLFNNGKELPIYTKDINDWLKKNRDKMIALDIKHSKGKDLDKFLLNVSLENKSFIEKLSIQFKNLL